MKSIKQNIKAMLFVGIAALIFALVEIPVSIATGFYEEYDSVAIYSDSSSLVVTKFNPMNILLVFVGAFLLLVGVLFIVVYYNKKDDSVSLEANGLDVVCSKKKFTIPYDEIESSTSNQNLLKIKRKSEEKSIGIWFIKNGYDLSKEINKKLGK